MRKNKVAKTDFTSEKLPHNRKEVFFDVLKMHWRTVLILALLVVIAFLPLCVIAFFRDNYGLALSIKVQEGSMSAEDRLATMKIVHIIAAGCEWASLYFACLFVGPIVRIIRQLVWNEPLFFKEDFIKGLKNNYKNGAIVATMTGIVMVITKVTLLIGNNGIVQAIPLALFLAFIVPPMILTYCMGSIYNGKFFKLFKNSILIYIKEAPLMIVFAFLLVGPIFLSFMDNNLIAKYIIAACLLFFVIPLTSIIYYLYANHIFDKWINKEKFPDFYKKGIYIE